MKLEARIHGVERIKQTRKQGDEGEAGRGGGQPKLMVCMKKPYIILILGMLIKKLRAEWSFPV